MTSFIILSMLGFQLAVKRTLDIVLSVAIILLLSPLLLIIAIAIKATSPGPVIFRQKRLGQNGRVFEIFKFRTMQDKARELRNPDGSAYTGKDDPRITPLGKFLRKVSLDELPQFFNVFLGDMSIVGPRPDQDSHLEKYEEGWDRKLKFRPGITGWAMVRGRNSIPWEKRVELDIWYIENYSLWLDLKIALMTIPVLIFGIGVNQGSTQTK